jgi:hypothetical protein
MARGMYVYLFRGCLVFVTNCILFWARELKQPFLMRSNVLESEWVGRRLQILKSSPSRRIVSEKRGSVIERWGWDDDPIGFLL